MRQLSDGGERSLTPLENSPPEDFRYEAALAAALSVVHTLSVRPKLSRQRELATVTYAVLEAIRKVEDRLRVGPLQLPAPVPSERRMLRGQLALPGVTAESC
jgi:hypothetical protein